MKALNTTLSVGLVSLLTGTAFGAPTSAKGYASPEPVYAGTTVTTVVNVTPATDPPSIGLIAKEDLSLLYGFADQTMYDDGTNGDHVAGDNSFTFDFRIAKNVKPGSYTIPFVVADSNGPVCQGDISVVVAAPACSADYNGDGDWGTDADIEAFFRCLSGDCCLTCGSMDFNGDGDWGTDADIESFFRVLGGGPC
jgi:hypothetical protein